MRTLLFIVTATMAASACAEPIADRERAIAVQRQVVKQQYIERARERCIANRDVP